MQDKNLSLQINSLMLLSVCSIALLLVLTNSIITLGQNIPQEDLVTDYTIGVIWAIILGIGILILPIQDKSVVFTLWLAKCFVTLVGMLFYEANYGLDSYGYFDSPRDSSFQFTGLQIGNGTENIQNLVWLYYRVMPESFHALKVSFAMVGLMAIYIFYRAAVISLQKPDIRILYALGLFPSILFWSSIIGKDPIVLLGISIYVYGVVGWYKFNKIRYLLILSLGVFLATLIRSWLAVILLTPMAFVSVQSVRGILPKFTLTVVMIGALILAWGLLQQQTGIENYEDTLATVDTTSRGLRQGGSAQDVTADFSQGNQAIAYIPIGIFSALFRPLPGEILNPFGLMASLENLWLLRRLWLALKRTRWKEVKTPLIQWAILFVLIWATFYGFLSQNLGTAARFKLQILPVLLSLLLYLGRQRQNVPATQPFLVTNKAKK